ncbi:hypothetical protein [Achromobacter sp. 413638]|uniref:hypothetical protein n=1 Tax=Achromobacter sp. 413638 TaxID=3342385 RepID=UPI00370CCE1C
MVPTEVPNAVLAGNKTPAATIQLGLNLLDINRGAVTVLEEREISWLDPIYLDLLLADICNIFAEIRLSLYPGFAPIGVKVLRKGGNGLEEAWSPTTRDDDLAEFLREVGRTGVQAGNGLERQAMLCDIARSVVGKDTVLIPVGKLYSDVEAAWFAVRTPAK